MIIAPPGIDPEQLNSPSEAQVKDLPDVAAVTKLEERVTRLNGQLQEEKRKKPQHLVLPTIEKST